MKKIVMKKIVGSLLLILSGALAVSGQTDARRVGAGEASARDARSAASPSTPFALEKGMNEFGVWGGGSFDSPTLIGKSENARFGLVAFRYARVLAAGNGMAFKYTIDAVPLALLSYERSRFVPQTPPNIFHLEQDRQTVYAAGLTPIGFQVNFRRRKRVQPFAATSGGFLYYTQPVPDERSTVEPNRRGAHFNFTADFGGGVQVLTGERRAYTFGYKYHHLSNGYRAPINPGFDSNLFYFGFSIFR
ncbi:MAG: acyloxyacyl hydrolase [Pyrinomonadaceae bacterium]